MRPDLEALAKAALALAHAAGGRTEVAFLAPAGAEAKAWIAGCGRAGAVERRVDEICGNGVSFLAWEGGVVARDDDAIALSPGPDGRAFEWLLCQTPEIVAKGDPGLDSGARLLRQGTLVALCPLSLTTPLRLRRLP